MNNTKQIQPRRHKKRRKHSFKWKMRHFFRLFGRALKELARSVLRICYRAGFAKCAVVGIVLVVVIAGISLIASANDKKRMEETAVPTPTAELQMTMEAEAEVAKSMENLVATPSPTPEFRYEKGDEGEEVQKIQTRLMELGYLDIDEPTIHFGNATKQAVKIFQRQHGVDQDGIVGIDTYNLLMSDTAQKYLMTEGAEGDDIEDFQDKLVELGYLEDNQKTGYYGTDTVNAVKKFQKRNKLKQDGKAGENTIEMINSADARVSYTKEKEIEAEKKAAEKAAAKKTVEGRINTFVSIAKSLIGKPYELGKKGPDSFDCSGFAYYCMRKADIYCRRLTASGYSKNSSWKKIESISDIKKGDLLFFKSDESSEVGHVGIYIGSGEMVDASSGNGKVVRRGCKTAYWKRNFVCARRPIS